MAAAVLGAMPLVAHAQQGEPPSFDRPGIAFSTSVFAPGHGSWEQGLPSITWSRDDALESRRTVLDTRVRVGIGHGLEAQLIAMPLGWSRNCSQAVCTSARGSGDGALALKWAPLPASATFSYAVLLTHKVASGQAPLGGGGNADQVALSFGRSMGENGALGGSVAFDRRSEGNRWMGSVNLSQALNDRLSGYVEVGIGNGLDHARVAGGGLAWAVSSRWKLDGWMLRGLDARTPTWQFGTGVSFTFGQR